MLGLTIVLFCFFVCCSFLHCHDWFCVFFFFFSSRRRHTRWTGDWSSDVCSSDLGLLTLLLPGVTAPPPFSAALMLAAGFAWGVYSIRGRGCADPAGETAANFLDRKSVV